MNLFRKSEEPAITPSLIDALDNHQLGVLFRQVFGDRMVIYNMRLEEPPPDEPFFQVVIQRDDIVVDCDIDLATFRYLARNLRPWAQRMERLLP